MRDTVTTKTRRRSTGSFLAAIVAALAIAASARAAQAQLTLLLPPDLVVSVAGPASVPAGTSATFQVTVRNVAEWGQRCFFDRLNRRFVCESFVQSGDAAGVRVDFALPGFTLTPAASPGAGFTCAGGVSCTGGLLHPDDSITIPVTAVAGAATGTFSYSATVDPMNAVFERDDNNNGAGGTVTITPPPPLPDLHMFGSASPSPFPQSLPVTFNMTAANLGTGAASNITLNLFTNLPAVLSSWTIGGGFSCNAPSPFGQRLQINCTGGNLAALSSAQVRIAVKLINGANPNLPSNLPSGTIFSMFGFLDFPNTIPESNEGDNAFTFTATVQ